MTSSKIIAVYEALLAKTGEMATAARDADWDRLTSLESQCRTLIEQVTPLDGVRPLAASERDRKVELIHQILTNDAEIRNCTQPWMAKMQRFLGSAGRERQLQNAYRSDA